MDNSSTSSSNNNQRPTRACTVIKAPGQKDDHDDQDDYDHHQLDHSVLTEPLNLGRQNVAQIAFHIKHGTEEVRDLLLNECNIIYECRVCTNLFRSFGNYIAHKRIYCKKHICEQMVLYDPFWLEQNKEQNAEPKRTEPKIHRIGTPSELDSGSNNNDNESIASASSSSCSNSIIRSPSKTLNLKRPSSLSLRGEKNNKRKRKTLVSIVNDLTKSQKNSVENGISISQFYPSEIPKSESTRISKRNSNNSSTTFLNHNKDDSQEFLPLSQSSSRRTSKKTGPRSRPKMKNFKVVHDELTALVNQKLASADGPKVATIDVPLLSPENLNQLYFCANFVFRCPHCIKDFAFFASAIRHLMKFHKCTRLKAKWVAYLHSQLTDEAVKNEEETRDDHEVKESNESDLEDQSSEHTPYPEETNPKVSSLKIVRVNEHYQAIPAGSETATKIHGESSTKPISDIKMSVEDDLNTSTFSGASSMINGVEELNESLPNPSENGNSTNSMTICINPVVVRKFKRKKNFYTIPKRESRNNQNACRFYHEIKPKIAKIVDDHLAKHGVSVPLPDDVFTPLYNCRGFMFKCPDCETPPVLCFANAVRHVTFDHVENKDHAKLFVFQNSKTVKKGTNNNVPLPQPTNGHCKPVKKSSSAIVSLQQPQNGSFISTNGKSFNSNLNTTPFPINSISANLALSTTASTSAATSSSATDSTASTTHKVCTKKKKHHITNGHNKHHLHHNHNVFDIQKNYSFIARPSSSSLANEVITIDSEEEDDAILPLSFQNETASQPRLDINNIEIKTEKCKIPTNSLVMIDPIKMIGSSEDFDEALGTYFLPGDDTRLEIEPSVEDGIFKYINCTSNTCLECPQLSFTDLNVLILHVAATHSQSMILVCNVCNKYAGGVLPLVQNHLFREHGVINEDTYDSLLEQKSKSSADKHALATQSESSNSSTSSTTSPKSCAKVNGHSPTPASMNGASSNGVNHNRFQPPFINSLTSSSSSKIHNRLHREHFP